MEKKVRIFLMTTLFVAPLFIFPCGIINAEVRGIERHPGGDVIHGPRGNIMAEGPDGNIAIGTRYNELPEFANPVIIEDQTYYVDENGVYYLPCEDDESVYCVVPPPRDN